MSQDDRQFSLGSNPFLLIRLKFWSIPSAFFPITSNNGTLSLSSSSYSVSIVVPPCSGFLYLQCLSCSYLDVKTWLFLPAPPPFSSLSHMAFPSISYLKAFVCAAYILLSGGTNTSAITAPHHPWISSSSPFLLSAELSIFSSMSWTIQL